MRKLVLALLVSAFVAPLAPLGAAVNTPLNEAADTADRTIDPAAAGQPTTSEETLEAGQAPQQEAVGCCWVFVWGRWYCMPC